MGDADDGAADGGFAGAGLPHQAEGLALVDVEGHIVHGPEGARLLPKVTERF
jgi:hypothetical protein